MTEKINLTERTQVKRKPERAQYDRQLINAVIDAALYGVIGFSDGKNVHVIPTAIWRIEDYLYIHGSKASRLLQELIQGAQACISITHVDALVLARSAFAHSMNYRSVCIYGEFSEAPEALKQESLRRFIEGLVPGRWQHIRQPTPQELAASVVLRIPLSECVYKGRQGPVVDFAQDMDQPVWAGLAPVTLQWLDLQQDSSQELQDLPGKAIRIS
ncbi:MAG: pyridoxamine 5'-phosphate oxidase family protein [Proteobacteria bacterium]|nr:pyridoxamine 5'-phosphate oxidase family protein [Pseudomonadota bacterium]